MSAWSLAWTYLWSRPLGTVLNIVLLSLGLSAMALVVNVQDQVDHAFERDLAGIDAVVGAKGSPMQLILSAVFHIDAPTGNISLAAAQTVAQHPLVQSAIPVSLGDNVGGWRIVGTSTELGKLYGATLRDGRWWSAPMEAVLGASVVAQRQWPVGQRFYGTHGLGQGGAVHDDGTPYTVVGVLQPCQCVLDRLVLTDQTSVWQIHEEMHTGEDPLDAQDLAAIASEREITAMLIRYRSDLAAVSYPRYVNQQAGLQAAAPAMEITRLLSMVGVGAQAARGMGWLLLIIAALSVFIALWTALRERKTDLALLRMLGAPAPRLLGLVLIEAFWLGVIASILGLLLAHTALWVLSQTSELARHVHWNPGWWAPAEFGLPFVAIGLSLFAAVVPALAAYRADTRPLFHPDPS
ncbi:ABC transporter permease [Hydrogenophaga sp. 5NK40-0174]|uniref:ABC transporter permease n=1 Tax=Hydrogenophaga sp. 5NK40-0174 TaxID=3127649 RepID=UPI003104228D